MVDPVEGEGGGRRQGCGYILYDCCAGKGDEDPDFGQGLFMPLTFNRETREGKRMTRRSRDVFSLPIH
jgi:hypothetical protein